MPRSATNSGSVSLVSINKTSRASCALPEAMYSRARRARMVVFQGAVCSAAARSDKAVSTPSSSSCETRPAVDRTRPAKSRGSEKRACSGRLLSSDETASSRSESVVASATAPRAEMTLMSGDSKERLSCSACHFKRLVHREQIDYRRTTPSDAPSPPPSPPHPRTTTS